MNKQILFALGFNSILALTIGTGCQPAATPVREIVSSPDESEKDPPEVSIGERLFLETRFAQFFAVNSNGEINQPLKMGDPTMDFTETLLTPLPGPNKGKSMNCAACHLVDQQQNRTGGGIRTYADFTERSPIPLREEDQKTMTLRNSPPLVQSGINRSEGILFHFDGEFSTIEELVIAGFTGRNFGWLPSEREKAIAHLAKVIREDDGEGELAQEFAGLSYKKLLLGKSMLIPGEFRIPEEYKIDVESATDEEIVKAVSKLVGAYVNSLTFNQNEKGEFMASPYDVFLKKNFLPNQPLPNEKPIEYARRLKKQLDSLEAPLFVDEKDQKFQFHNQNFQFGNKELEGLKIFLQETEQLSPTSSKGPEGKTGNCLACHTPPFFTDFRFHNTGVTQKEYDTTHGPEAFLTLFIPTAEERKNNPELYFPASATHQDWKGRFLEIPEKNDPQKTDLGVWNVLANPNHPQPQEKIRKIICDELKKNSCSEEEITSQSIASFKTASLRDLGHSDPYMHNGKFRTISSVIQHYIEFSDLARSGKMRNPPSSFTQIFLTTEDIEPLEAFLNALNEDYN